MEKIPTAEEFLQQKAEEHSYKTWYEFNYDTHEEYQGKITIEVLREFARLHVEAALKAAAEKADLDLDLSDPSCDVYIVSKNSITSAYPVSNIK